MGCGVGASHPGWANFHQAGILLESRTVSPATNLFLMNLGWFECIPVPFTGGIYSPSTSADLKTIGFDFIEQLLGSVTPMAAPKPN